MSKTYSTTEKTTSCPHIQTIQDDREGSIVCLECCRVLDNLYSTDMYYYVKSDLKKCEKKEESQRKKEDTENKNFIKMYSVLEEMADKTLHLTNKMLEEVKSLYFKLKNEEKLQTFKMEKLLAYCLYNILNINQCSRSTQEIISFFPNLNNTHFIHKIQEIVETLNIIPVISTNSDFSDVICSYLDFSYKEKIKIKYYVEQIEDETDINPNTIIACIIYTYCKQYKIKKSLNEICKVCDVSQSGVYRAIKNCKPLKELINKIKSCDK